MTNIETRNKLNEYIAALDDLKGFSDEGAESLKIERLNQTYRKDLINKNIKLVNLYNENRSAIQNRKRLKAAIISMIGIIMVLLIGMATKMDVSFIALSAIPAFPLGILTISYYENKKLENNVKSLPIDPKLIETCDERIAYCNEHIKHYDNINQLIKEVENRINVVSDQLKIYEDDQLIFTNVEEIEEEIESIKRLVNTYNGH